MAGRDEETGGDKEYDATPRKLEQAREQGDVPRSQEAGAALTLMLFAALLLAGGGTVARPLNDGLQQLWSIEALRTVQSGGSLTLVIAPIIARAVLPLMTALAIAGLFLQLAQMGFTLPSSDEAGLKLDLNRLDVIKNAKEKWGLKALLDGAKNLFKLIVVGAVVVYSAMGVFDEAPAFLILSPVELAHALAKEIGTAVARVAAVVLVIAVIDYFLERFRFMRRMRMSKQDIKDEMKQTEGDPLIKQARKRRAQELLTKQAVHTVKDATVLVANPTHFSVTLRYRRGTDEAPIVLGKGRDRIALKMREKAREHGVPIVENKPLARTLYAVGKEGKAIPVDLYRQVAEVLAFVMAPRPQPRLRSLRGNR